MEIWVKLGDFVSVGVCICYRHSDGASSFILIGQVGDDPIEKWRRIVLGAYRHGRFVSEIGTNISTYELYLCVWRQLPRAAIGSSLRAAKHGV